MRAIYLPESTLENSEILITGEKLHHLLNVVRAKADQDILLLNGRGLKARGKIERIEKNHVIVAVSRLEVAEQPERQVHVAFGIPKKDSLEVCLRACVELGVGEIFLTQTERSQRYALREERINRILTASLEQSNNPFMPQVKICPLQDLPFQNYENIFLASLKTDGSSIQKDSENSALLLIGPEGGFSDEEETMLLRQMRATQLRFPTPILRTQTAIPAFISYLAAKLYG